MDENLKSGIAALMKRNRRSTNGHSYIVPSPELYPFQWLWDSCFHTTILSHLDMNAAYEELRSALARPLPNGLLPHIIYWKDDYRVTNWGREMRGDIISQSWGTDGTSAITQPPLIASTLWHLHTRLENQTFLHECYPVLRSYYLSLLHERDPDGRGLLGIINPDESGEDNSPRFDRAQGLQPNHSDKENLDKRILRIKENRDCHFDADECMRKYFWVEDVSFNAVLLRALEALADIAEVIGEKSDANIFRACAKDVGRAMRDYMFHDGLFYSLEGHTRKWILVKTWNIFMPLYAGILSADEARSLVEQHLLKGDEFWTSFPIPSVSKSEKVYRKDNFWRGPTWMAINWFVHKGLKTYEFNDIAETLKQKSTELVQKSGFREYYNPETGAGLGTKDFTWGALIIDMN